MQKNCLVFRCNFVKINHEIVLIFFQTFTSLGVQEWAREVPPPQLPFRVKKEKGAPPEPAKADGEDIGDNPETSSINVGADDAGSGADEDSVPKKKEASTPSGLRAGNSNWHRVRRISSRYTAPKEGYTLVDCPQAECAHKFHILDGILPLLPHISDDVLDFNVRWNRGVLNTHVEDKEEREVHRNKWRAMCNHIRKHFVEFHQDVKPISVFNRNVKKEKETK